MSAQTDYLAAVVPPVLGLTVTRGPFYQPVCLRCGSALAVRLSRRSHALVALDIHSADCGGAT